MFHGRVNVAARKKQLMHEKIRLHVFSLQLLQGNSLSPLPQAIQYEEEV